MWLLKAGGCLIQFKYICLWIFGQLSSGCLIQVGCLIEVTTTTGLTVSILLVEKKQAFYLELCNLPFCEEIQKNICQDNTLIWRYDLVYIANGSCHGLVGGHFVHSSRLIITWAMAKHCTAYKMYLQLLAKIQICFAFVLSASLRAKHLKTTEYGLHEAQFHLWSFAKSADRSLCTSQFWKHAYSNIMKISPPKTESFQIKIPIFFHISAQIIDCGYSLELPPWGSSNEYP